MVASIYIDNEDSLPVDDLEIRGKVLNVDVVLVERLSVLSHDALAVGAYAVQVE